MVARRRVSLRFRYPRFANDDRGRLVRWNKAAEELLGYRGEEVLGRSCHDVVCGRDIFGNRFCLPGCPHVNEAHQDRPLHDFVMDMRTAGGTTLRARLSVRSRRSRTSRRLLMIHTIRAVDD